ncbi:hypothetical protein TVAG_145630 [Trichomonas vaginalis G3]|uniref:Uncharacterized protein n=1 Tax=Trichomonas vaginalis (strain ATCC PRA-98 / G3) TaxID=412133 RepID=A2EFT2_TRIV3|nr:guanylate cyclase protein [Trichomonas vaginalis G3]EAY08483.1 hypothetical protein TVAG_145630 [Trichomonas vaginalis G3]KAI5537760.1 guanylate cyclase protein [Trichomonas vaginalis G3]|eukprot:XP_001320706.1 hypothetical protein [Trichomonas vaginalis G3]
MEETQPTSTALSTEIATSAMSKYSCLIDIPLSYRVIDSLTSLFNYFDIYAPRMHFFHVIVTVFRFFQLMGGAFMAGNTSSFAKGTLSYSAVSILTIFFHVVPLEYRYGNAVYILYAFNGFLILNGIYLLITAFVYKSTSKVPRVSCILLSIFMAFGPFLCLPIIA